LKHSGQPTGPAGDPVPDDGDRLEQALAIDRGCQDIEVAQVGALALPDPDGVERARWRCQIFCVRGDGRI
jgi:hypothetical protein